MVCQFWWNWVWKHSWSNRTFGQFWNTMFRFLQLSFWNLFLFQSILSSMNHIFSKLAQTTLIYEITFWHWHWLNSVSPTPTHPITPWVLFFVITVVLNAWRLTVEKKFWFSTSLKHTDLLLSSGQGFPRCLDTLHYRSSTLSLYHSAKCPLAVIVIILSCHQNSLKEI